MDINVHVTFDASDKLAHLIHELASAVSLCGKPERRAAYEVSATPELVPTTLARNVPWSLIPSEGPVVP